MSDQPPMYLVVDDNEMNRDMLVRRLSRQGYTAETAVDGQQALEMMKADPLRYDIVLLDIMMPGLNGYDVLEKMKHNAALHDIPVIMISAVDEEASVIKCIELGAEDYLTKPINPVLLQARLRPTLERKRVRDQERAYLQRIEAEKHRADKLLNVVIPLGISLSAERDFDQLLEMVVIQAMELGHADGGTLYLRRDNQLHFGIVRNRSLNIEMGGTSGKPITFPALPLYTEDGKPNENHIAAYCALHGQIVNIPDAYAAADFDFSGTRAFDARTGYRTTSVLAIPLRTRDEQVTGVLQLINATDLDTGQVIPFDRHIRELGESLALLATASLQASIREIALRREIEELRIVIDEQRKARAVEEITESEYFRDLQTKISEQKKRFGKSAAG